MDEVIHPEPGDMRVIDSVPRLEVGEVVAGRFTIEAVAGEGAMGSVYRARDETTGQTVAVKILIQTEARFIDRFRQEAEVLAKLSHPGIVRYVAHGMTRTGIMYIAMEWLQGEDLASRILREPLTFEESLLLVRRIADALGCVHEYGIVHRDIKPSNLFLPDYAIERVKLLDFGVVRMTASLSRLTERGTTIGTPGYMSPEQARGDDVIDTRSDIFSLGCVFFECMTGQPAFKGVTLVAVLGKILFEAPPRVRDVWSTVPDELDELVSRMMAKEPDERPQDGRVLSETLESLVQANLFGQYDDSHSNITVDFSPGRVNREVQATRRASRSKSLLTAQEQRIVSVVLAGGSGAGNDDGGARLSLVRQAALAFGGDVEPLADGSLLTVISTRGTPPKQAMQAAQCALQIKAVLPDAPLVLALGRGVIAERFLIGEVIDVAVALLDDTQPGQLRVDDLAASLLDANFHQVKEGGAIHLLRERDELDSPRRVLGKSTRCVGRDGELALLESTYLTCVTEPAARAVILVSPAGAGKTRLCQEFISRLRHRSEKVSVMFGRGDVMRSERAYGVLGQVLRRAAELSSGQLVEEEYRRLEGRLAQVLSESALSHCLPFLVETLGGSELSPPSVQFDAAKNDAVLMGDRIQGAWAEWFAAEAANQPLLLVLEDIHWADIPSVQVISDLLRRLADAPLMVLALARPELDERFPQLWRENDVTALRLGGLSRRATAQLVEQVLGDGLEPETVERLVEQAQGNPFYLEELMWGIADGSQQTLPETVIGMVQSRLDQLDPDGRQVLRAASIFGRMFWSRGIERLLGAEVRASTVMEWLDVLASRELIHERKTPAFPGEREFEFRNEMLREAAYAMLTGEDRVLGHRLAGEWLESVGERDAIIMADHFERGRQHVRAVAWYRRAAEEACDGHDFVTALSCTQRGMACGASGHALGRLFLIQADAHRWRGEYLASVQAAQSALAAFEAGTSEWFQGAALLVLVAGLQGQLETLNTWVGRITETEPTTLEARRFRVIAMVRAASRLLYAGRYNQASKLLQRAEREARQSGVMDPHVTGPLERTRAYYAYFRGDLMGRLRHFELAGSAYEAAGDLRNACVVRVSLGYSLLEMGDDARAESVLRDALQTSESLGLQSLGATIRHNLGLALVRQNRLDEAQATFRHAIDAFEAQANDRMAGSTRVHLAETLAAAHRAAEAEVEANRAIEMLANFPPNQAYAYARLAQLLLSRGLLERARVHAAKAKDTLDSLGRMSAGEALVRLVYADALYRAGEVGAAKEELGVALRSVQAKREQIDDPSLRRCFLERVPENAQVLDLARRWGLIEDV